MYKSNSLADGNGHDQSAEEFRNLIISRSSGESNPTFENETLLEIPQPDRISRGRVAIFIDAASLFYAAQQLNIIVDYGKLLCQLVDGARLLRALFYTGVDSNNQKQQGFLLWLRRNGYRVITKELILLPDGSRKANVEVEMAVDMLDLAPYYDTAIVVSGNGGLTYAVDNVGYLGVRVEIVSLRAMTSDALIGVADSHIDLEQIKDQIQKR